MRRESRAAKRGVAFCCAFGAATRLVAALPALLALVENGRPRMEAARVIRVGALGELHKQKRPSSRPSRQPPVRARSAAMRSARPGPGAPCCRSPCCGTSAPHPGPRAAWAAAQREDSEGVASARRHRARAYARRERSMRCRTGGLGGSTGAAGGSAGWSAQKKPWRQRMQASLPPAPAARAASPSGSGSGAGPRAAAAGGLAGFSCVCLPVAQLRGAARGVAAPWRVRRRWERQRAAARAPRDGHEEAEVVAALLAAAPLLAAVVEDWWTGMVSAAAFCVGVLAVLRIAANALAQQHAVAARRRHAPAGSGKTQRLLGAGARCSQQRARAAQRTRARAPGVRRARRARPAVRGQRARSGERYGLAQAPTQAGLAPAPTQHVGRGSSCLARCAARSIAYSHGVMAARFAAATQPWGGPTCARRRGPPASPARSAWRPPRPRGRLPRWRRWRRAAPPPPAAPASAARARQPR